VPSAPTPKVIQAHKPVVVALQQVEVQFDALKREIDSVVNMEVSLTNNEYGSTHPLPEPKLKISCPRRQIETCDRRSGQERSSQQQGRISRSEMICEFGRQIARRAVTSGMAELWATAAAKTTEIARKLLGKIKGQVDRDCMESR
jgi:hypothetical protein